MLAWKMMSNSLTGLMSRKLLHLKYTTVVWCFPRSRICPLHQLNQFLQDLSYKEVGFISIVVGLIIVSRINTGVKLVLIAIKLCTTTGIFLNGWCLLVFGMLEAMTMLYTNILSTNRTMTCWSSTWALYLHNHLQGVQRVIRKRENVQWAAVLSVKKLCWCQRLEENGQTALANNH